jgi:hypothetical protein
MAGAKGRSGGARPGAGRKKKNPDVEVRLESQPHGGALKRSEALPQEPALVETRDPLEFLLDVMQGTVEPSAAQLKAAIAATQYKHAKMGEGGKKDARADAAKQVGGRFSQAAPPRLAASGGKKV